MQIKRLKVAGLWSFGDEPLELFDLKKHNVLIGKNNAGKSRVLRAIQWVSKNHDKFRDQTDVGSLENIVFKPGRGTPSAVPIQLEMDVEPDDAIRDEAARRILEGFGKALPPPDELDACVSDLTNSSLSLAVRRNHEGKHIASARLSLSEAELQLKPTTGFWKTASEFVRKMYLGELSAKVNYVAGWRRLEDPVEHNEPIVKRLNLWRSPPVNQAHLRDQYNKFQALYQELIRNSDVDVVADFTGSNFAMDIDGRYLPISQMGDGLQQFVMIAYHLASNPNCLLLIEEPETHIHPGLQRNLMRVLYRELQGQSLTATHSPVLLDASLGANVIRVEHDGNQSRATCCATPSDLRSVLDVLDVRASDLLQANVVIWVEGPTDRMFLTHTLDLHTSGRFVDGVDYQFAYYGGDNRAHVTMDDQLAKDLVNLLRLCRNVIMVCDSDRSTPDEPINTAKERLRKECEAVGGLYWITDGREIENYIPDSVLNAAYQSGALLGERACPITLTDFGRLGDALAAAYPDIKRGDHWKINYNENKARVMPEILKHIKTKDDLSRLGLAERLSEFAARIEKANPQ